MRTQTYFHTEYAKDANKKDDTVPLQVNCVGVVGPDHPFVNRGIREDYYYIYVLQGQMVMEECILYPGEVIVMEPEHAYQYYSEGETSYLWVHYTGYEAWTLTFLASLKLNEKCYIGIHDEIIDCFKKLFREFQINDRTAGFLSVCILSEILHLTGRYVHAGEKKRMPLLAIEYIHRHYKEKIDIKSLAQMEHLGCTMFRNAFKQHTGASPSEYIITHRISEACRLLNQTDMSISAVAVDVGYHDQYYFSRIFKKKVGMPPLKYRMRE